ncbi:MAG: N-acetylgalactosamine 6-sulfate sulfatase, partial [Bacteroidota bacterium]
QIPARDGVATGQIQRSNRWPNCSFFTNWTNVADKITWNIELVESGDFEVILYYTCAAENVGGSFELSFNDIGLIGTITEAHDPPLLGLDSYRYPNGESYTKYFKPLNLGKIHWQKGKGTLSLNALTIPNEALMDFRLLMIKRLE